MRAVRGAHRYRAKFGRGGSAATSFSRRHRPCIGLPDQVAWCDWGRLLAATAALHREALLRVEGQVQPYLVVLEHESHPGNNSSVGVCPRTRAWEPGSPDCRGSARDAPSWDRRQPAGRIGVATTHAWASPREPIPACAEAFSALSKQILQGCVIQHRNNQDLLQLRVFRLQALQLARVRHGRGTFNA